MLSDSSTRTWRTLLEEACWFPAFGAAAADTTETAQASAAQASPSVLKRAEERGRSLLADTRVTRQERAGDLPLLSRPSPSPPTPQLRQ